MLRELIYLQTCLTYAAALLLLKGERERDLLAMLHVHVGKLLPTFARSHIRAGVLYTSSSTREGSAKGVWLTRIGRSSPVSHFQVGSPGSQTPQAASLWRRGTSNGSDIAAREFKSLTPRGARYFPLLYSQPPWYLPMYVCAAQSTNIYRQHGEKRVLPLDNGIIQVAGAAHLRTRAKLARGGSSLSSLFLSSNIFPTGSALAENICETPSERRGTRYNAVIFYLVAQNATRVSLRRNYNFCIYILIQV